MTNQPRRRSHRRGTTPVLASLVLCLTAVFAACSSGGGTTGTQKTSPGGSETTSPAGGSGSTALTGTWDGTYESTSGEQGTFTIEFVPSAAGFSGTIQIEGSACISEGTITATVAGDAIQFGAVEGQVTVAFTGTIAGDSMSGDYSSPECNGQGTWEASRSS